MPRDPARTKLVYLSAWVDQCEAFVRDVRAASPAPQDRSALARCWAVATRARSRISRLQSEWTRTETRTLIAACRRRKGLGPA